MHTENVAFWRVSVDNIVAGGARVSWELNRHMVDVGPYVFQLQFGHTGLADADDWVDVGSAVTDAYSTFDTEKRVWGKTLDTHYRVKLTTATATYYSEAENADGHLIKRDWLNAREMVRKELLRHRVLTSPEGYLLKARRYGPRCVDCLDEYTEEVSKTNCQTCYGTGFTNGYFDPMPACYADVSVDQNRDHRDGSHGTVKDDVIRARFIGDPQLYSYDAWVDKASDMRYYIHTTAVAAQVRNVAIVYDAELKLAPYSDVIYTVPVQDYVSSRPQAQKPAAQKAKEATPWREPNLNYLEAAAQELRARRARSSRR